MTHKQIPSGDYDIVSSRRKGQFRLDPRDVAPFNNQYDVYDGTVNYEGKLRNGFNFHLGTNSEGCVTTCGDKKTRGKEWALIEKIVKSGEYSTHSDNTGNHRTRRLLGIFGVKQSPRLKLYGKMIVIGADSHITVK